MDLKDFLKNEIMLKDAIKNIAGFPNSKGIYIVTTKESNIEFLDTTTAPKEYKGKNLLYDKNLLIEKYKSGDKKILYIGKTSCKDGLENRISSYLRFAQGKKTAHRGGRAIWQIKNWENLFLYYYETENADKIEKELLSNYKEKYGDFPLANWRK